MPLSPALDSVGVRGRSASCCASLWVLLSDEVPPRLEPRRLPPHLAIPSNYVLGGLDRDVASAFARVISRLGDAGARLKEVAVPELDELPRMNAGGGFQAAESFAWHRDRIGERGADYDPRVLSRILRGQQESTRDLLELHTHRKAIITSVRGRLRYFDASMLPTVPLVAPPLHSLEDDDDFVRASTC